LLMLVELLTITV